MKRWIMIIDIAKCHNCNNCFLACKDEHVGNDWSPISREAERHGKGFRTIELKERGSYPLLDAAYKPGNCMMCEDPACVRAGKGAVYKREDGIVLIDTEKAAGRKDLIDACPYHAIVWNETLQLPQKCTFCAHLLDQGWTETRCSHICPTGATKFTAIDSEKLESYIASEGLTRYKDEYGTKPMVFYKNLYRFTSLAVFGSLIKEGECFAGAEVIAYAADGDVSTDKIMSTAISNAYGDFKLDGLKEGRYAIEVRAEDRAVFRKTIELKDSENIGDIVIG